MDDTFSADFLAYGAHLDRLETARQVFLRERDALLDALSEIPSTGAGFDPRRMRASRRQNGRVEFAVEAGYAKLRGELGLPSYSGFSLVLRSFGDDAFAGFQTVAWFAMNARSADVVGKILGVDAVLHGLQFLRTFHEQAALYVRLSAIPFDATDFTRDRLAAAARALPAQYLALEERIIAAHHQLGAQLADLG